MGPLHGVPTLTTVKRTLILCTLAALAVVACGSTAPTAVPPTTHVLDGSGFAVQFPESWSSTTRASGGVTAYEMSSHGALNSSGVPVAGAIGITIQVVPVSVLVAGGVKNPGVLTAAQLMSGVVGTPPNATGVKLTAAIHTVEFGGDKAAAAMTVTYTSGGIPNLQEDQIDKHGTTVYLVELDTEPSLKAAGEAAVASLLKSWTWTAASS
jgi:hypothetical protein